MLHKKFIFHTRHYYIMSLRSLFVNYKYAMFIHQFFEFYNKFKLICLNLNINISFLNSSLVTSVYPNLNYLNFMKSKYILLYSKTHNIFNILNYIKNNNYIKIFAISFKNHFINLDWFFKIYSHNQLISVLNCFFIILYFFNLLFYIIMFIFRSLFFIKY